MSVKQPASTIPDYDGPRGQTNPKKSLRGVLVAERVRLHLCEERAFYLIPKVLCRQMRASGASRRIVRARLSRGCFFQTVRLPAAVDVAPNALK